MATARTQVVDLLQALVPAGVRVLPYARDIDAPGDDGTVMVRVDEVAPSSQPQTLREYTFGLILVVPQLTTGEAKLDELLDTILDALESGNNGIVWTAATRATFEEKFPSYEITTTVHAHKE